METARRKATRRDLAAERKELMQDDLDYKQVLFEQCIGPTPDQIASRGKQPRRSRWGASVIAILAKLQNAFFDERLRLADARGLEIFRACCNRNN